MSITTHSGSPQFPNVTGNISASTQEDMDKAIEELRRQKDAWVKRSCSERVAMIDQLIRDFAAVAKLWVVASQKAKGISGESPFGYEEWMTGPWPVLKNLRQLRQSLIDIETHGRPRIPGKITTAANGQVIAGVFPQNTYDSIFFTGVKAELWMEPGVTAETLPETQALAYRDKNHEGKVALVLGAGNISSIGPMDILYKLFVEDQVTILKMNPVNAYLGPLIEEGFHALIEPGFLRVSYGGATEGAYLCQHAGIDEVHITGSDKTFDAIVFGGGAEGATRKAQNKPLLTKRITGELGNVSPIIVVPGPWKTQDIAYQATHIATTLTINAGFNCNATRVIVQHSGWEQSEELMQAIRDVLKNVPTRDAYYPGARDRQRNFVAAHPDAEQIGKAHDKQLPWTLITGVQPGNPEDICYNTEAFCGLFAETELDADSVADYIDRAVTFANEELWGTLNATIIVHPASLKQPAVAAAMERAVANLRYGTIGVNYWAGSGYTLGTTTWGAFPGHALTDIQSGVGVVHNVLMFANSQKTVLHGPFRSPATPPWFVTQSKVGGKVFPRLVDFEVSPSPLKVPGLMRAALFG